MEANEYIFGLHAVIEAIEAGRDIDKILVKKDIHSEMAARLHDLARTYRIPMQRVPVEKLNRITRKNHQGVVALLSAVTYQKLEDIVPQLYEDGIQPFLLVLDGVTDVRNFGGMARTAECCGVNAIVIPERGSVTVNADAVKTSAGALHYLPVCRERDGAVLGAKDELTGGIETLNICLSKIAPEVQEVVISATVYVPNDDNVETFGGVENARITVIDEDTDEPLCFYELSKDYKSEDALVAARFVINAEGEWEFEAVGNGYNGGLQTLVDMYTEE